MKKICFITQGVLPVPTVRGGAVETLVEYIIDNINGIELCISNGESDIAIFNINSKKAELYCFLYTK